MKKLTKQKDYALRLRREGMSYSQIKEQIRVSKSTLSLWLSEHPLSQERIYELRGGNLLRIERCRNTKALKREAILNGIYDQAKKDIGNLSKRELLLAGLFLYWGEGTKAARDVLAFTNTDPDMMRFFVGWLELLGVPKSSLKAKLHLYKDMDVVVQTRFWSKKLDIPVENFWKPYIKDSLYSSLTYKNSFGQGTCSVHYGNSDLHNRVMMSLKRLREIA